jgi:hypothetical protein
MIAAMTSRKPHIEKPDNDSRSAGGSRGNVVSLRMADLKRLMRHRRGPILPADDDGRDDIFIMLSHIASTNNAVQQAKHFLEVWAPWMSETEGDEAMRNAIAASMKWTADELGVRLNLTNAERNALRITTIGAVDFDADARKKRRAEEHRARQRERRLKQRQRPKPPAVNQRADAIMAALPTVAEVPVTWLVTRLRNTEAFRSLKTAASMRKVVHREVDELERRGLAISSMKPSSRRGIDAQWLRRARDSDNDPKPTTEAGYRAHFLKRLSEFTPETTKQISVWFRSERDLRVSCGASEDAFHDLAQARWAALTGLSADAKSRPEHSQ